MAVGQPRRISAPGDARVNIVVAAPLGAATEVTLLVSFIVRNVTMESPLPFRHEGLSYTWKLGTIPFGSSREIRVLVKGLCVPPPLPPGSGPITGCGTTGAVGFISMTSSTRQGVSFPAVIYIFKVENWATSGPAPTPSATLFVALGIVASRIVSAVALR